MESAIIVSPEYVDLWIYCYGGSVRLGRANILQDRRGVGWEIAAAQVLALIGIAAPQAWLIARA